MGASETRILAVTSNASLVIGLTFLPRQWEVSSQPTPDGGLDADVVVLDLGTTDEGLRALEDAEDRPPRTVVIGDDERPADGLPDGVLVLQRPYTIDDLASCIEHLLLPRGARAPRWVDAPEVASRGRGSDTGEREGIAAAPPPGEGAAGGAVEGAAVEDEAPAPDEAAGTDEAASADETAAAGGSTNGERKRSLAARLFGRLASPEEPEPGPAEASVDAGAADEATGTAAGATDEQPAADPVDGPAEAPRHLAAVEELDTIDESAAHRLTRGEALFAGIGDEDTDELLIDLSTAAPDEPADADADDDAATPALVGDQPADEPADAATPALVGDQPADEPAVAADQAAEAPIVGDDQPAEAPAASDADDEDGDEPAEASPATVGSIPPPPPPPAPAPARPAARAMSTADDQVAEPAVAAAAAPTGTAVLERRRVVTAPETPGPAPAPIRPSRWFARRQRQVSESERRLQERLGSVLAATSELERLLEEVPLLASLPTLARAVVADVAAQLEADSVGLWRPAERGWKAVAHQGLTRHESTWTVPFDQPLFSEVHATGGAMLIDPVDAVQAAVVGIGGAHTASFMAAAIAAGPGRYGILAVGRNQQLVERDLDTLAQVAFEIAPGMAVAEQLERLRASVPDSDPAPPAGDGDRRG